MAERKKGDPKDAQFIEWRNQTIQQKREWHSYLSSETSTWGLETMKHIALVALAGLAGVFVLISTGDKVEPNTAFYCAGLFSAGSFLCVLGMYLGYLARWKNSQYQNKLLVILYANEIPEAKEYDSPASVIRIGLASDITGWIAAILTAIGGLLLFNELSLKLC